MTVRAWDDYSDLMPCPACGAHVWTHARVVAPAFTPMTAETVRIVEVRCGECNHHARCQDLQYPATVGRD